MRMKFAAAVAAVGACSAMCAVPAHAAPEFRLCPAQPTCDQVIHQTIASAGDDSYMATCAVLADQLIGYPSADRVVFLGVASAIAQHYGITLSSGLRVELYQISNYCPAWLANWGSN